MPHDLERVGTLSLDEVLPYVPRKQGRRVVRTYYGKKVSLGRKRLRIIASKGTTCPHCGMEASFAAIERHKDSNQYHIHLYGLDYLGDEVELTIDHIIPKAAGGRNDWNNLQTMCEKCNTNKGARADVRGRAGISQHQQNYSIADGEEKSPSP